MDGRWRFLDPNNVADVAHRARVEQRMDEWWRSFRENEGKLRTHFRNESHWDISAWMAETLGTVHPVLMWEFGPAVRCDGHRLVITPENDHHLRPLVDTLLRRAPSLDGWEFYDARLPEQLEIARLTVDARSGGSIEGVTALVAPGEDRRIDLTFCGPNTTGPDDEQARRDAFVAAETLLGEQVLDRWIGEIRVAPLRRSTWRLFGKRPPAESVELHDLKARVSAMIQTQTSALPEAPHYKWVPSSEWTIYKLAPTTQADYLRQCDLFVATTPSTSLWQATRSPSTFYSERFSRCGELFAYVKLDGSQGLDEQGFADKAEIEDAIDEVLVSQGLGCHLGGGTGLRYSYINLALVDHEEGIRAVCERLRHGKVPHRSWIQFFDAPMTREWVGIYPDSPPPPMPDE